MKETETYGGQSIHILIKYSANHPTLPCPTLYTLTSTLPAPTHLRRFNDLLSSYRTKSMSLATLCKNVLALFAGQADLIAGFIEFLPPAAQAEVPARTQRQ
jgi:hypothetical protein